MNLAGWIAYHHPTHDVNKSRLYCACNKVAWVADEARLEQAIREHGVHVAESWRKLVPRIRAVKTGAGWALAYKDSDLLLAVGLSESNAMLIENITNGHIKLTNEHE